MPTVADRLVSYARAQLGKPYVWGAEGPNGFDCSGLVYAAEKAAGLDVSRTTAATLGRQGTAVPLSQAQPGDLAYFDNPGTTDHIAIVSGGGRMIEAPTQGVPVREVPLRTPTSIRRIPGIQSAVTGADFAGTSASGVAVADDGSGGILGLFSGWQNSLANIALKVTAGAAVVGLVVVSVRAGITEKGT